MSTVTAAGAGYMDAALRDEVDRSLSALAGELTAGDVVTAAMRYAVGAGGKRLRPLLCLAAMDAAGGAPGSRESQLRAGCALELMHTYSLVHDDLPCMDDDDLRRGQPTTHRAYGSPAAMLAGFALIPRAARLLHDSALEMGVSPALAAEAVRGLCRGAGAAGMVGGQLLDLQSERISPDAAALRRIHAMKTGALFRAALRIGGILGGGSPGQIEALSAFGSHLGMAFQITDDVLDVTMDSAALGKTAGKDLDADKATFAAQMGVAGAREAAGAEVDAALGALSAAGLKSPVLERLARFAVDRNR
ncbi:MAG TPA: farnesyl diphosphate synthase [Longimicrobiales bacterium]|nr:farnesyl diphosphate synthase [Longimicrobiales bacterium]